MKVFLRDEEAAGTASKSTKLPSKTEDSKGRKLTPTLFFERLYFCSLNFLKEASNG